VETAWQPVASEPLAAEWALEPVRLELELSLLLQALPEQPAELLERVAASVAR
jgi:hypothetical protein